MCADKRSVGIFKFILEKSRSKIQLLGRIINANTLIKSRGRETRLSSCICFYGSCSKFPPTWCFKRTHLYALTVLEVRICNWFYWAETKVSAEPTPTGGSGRPGFLASCSSAAALLGWWPLPSSSKPVGQLLRVLSLSSSISDLSLSLLLLIRILVTALNILGFQGLGFGSSYSLNQSQW